MINNKEIHLKLPQPCSGLTTALQQPCKSLAAAALHWFPYGSDPMVAALQSAISKKLYNFADWRRNKTFARFYHIFGLQNVWKTDFSIAFCYFWAKDLQKICQAVHCFPKNWVRAQNWQKFKNKIKKSDIWALNCVVEHHLNFRLS